MEPVYLFFHLAKTGGTTFIGNLYNHMNVDEDFFDLGPHGEEYRTKYGLRPLQERTLEERNRMKVVAGHLVYWNTQELFPNREKRYVLFLREPISRVISHYTFDSSEGHESFSRWYLRWIPNQMTVFLKDHLQVDTVQGILEKLKLFWHIGIKEDLDKSLKQLYKELKLPTEYVNRRVAGEKYNSTTDLGYDTGRIIRETYKPTERELAMIKHDHEIDIKLYNHIVESLKDFNYVPSYIPDVLQYQ